MIVSFLFNANHPKYGGSYGDPIRTAIFGSGIVQASGRHLKVSVGDVLIYGRGKTWADYDLLTERTYFAGTWSMLLEDRLRQTFRKATVYAVTFENMTEDLALRLHNELASDEAYLGVLEVDYRYGPHLALFRNMMITLYRVQGTTCRVFFSMGEEDGKDDHEVRELRNLGFTDVDWEDRGAHGTIFDDYDTLEHYSRVGAFRDAVAPFLTNGQDDASELVMVLEDLNPQLFNALGAAVETLARASHEEDVAQASLSGRRYLEKLADVLFPAREGLHDGRKVGRDQYRNRLWAFITANSNGDVQKSKSLGGEVDRLVEEFNAGLHGDQEKDRMLRALADAGALTAVLLSLNPGETRKPYYAHEKRILDFLKEVTRYHE